MLYSLIIALVLIPFCFVCGFHIGRTCGQAEGKLEKQTGEKPKKMKLKKHAKHELSEADKVLEAIDKYTGPLGVQK